MAGVADRRTFLAVGLSAAVLAGCGADDHAAPGGTRSVASAKGPVRVPARAERVVCLDLSKIERMLDVGCTPVGVPVGWQPLDQHAAWYAGARKIGTQADVKIEQVAALHPDLILGSPLGVSDTLYAKLSALAPTVLLDAPGAGAQWKPLSAADAEAAGRAPELRALQARYQRRVTALRTVHRQALAATTWGIAFGLPGAAYAFTPAAGMGQLLTDLGARFSRAAAAPGVARRLSYEQLDRFGDATVILTDAQADQKPAFATATMLGQPVFRALPAARADHVYPLSHLLVFSYGEALALLDQLDTLLSRVDGR